MSKATASIDAQSQPLGDPNPFWSPGVTQYQTEPKVLEINVHYNGGGKVAIEEYGGESYSYGASVTRKYTIPPLWTEEQVKKFELAQVLDIRENIDPLLQVERDALIEARKY